jgi:hypothetical protein
MRIITLIILFSLTSCGFKPMLAKNTLGSQALNEVKVVRITAPDKLRAERIVSETFNDNWHISPLYELNIDIGYENSAIGILKDSQSTRYRVKVTLNYTLLDIETHKQVDSSSLYLYSSYDVAESEFMNYISTRYVSDNILKDLCSELKNRLILVLSSSKQVGK